MNDTTGSTAPVPDDYDDGTGTTGVLKLDSETGVALAYGDVDSGGDVDWFKLDLEADQSVIVRMTGYNPETKSLYGGIKKPQIKGVYDTDGNLLPDTRTTDDTGVWQSFGTESRISGFMTGGGGEWKEARLLFKTEKAGTYYVAVGGLESVQSGTDTALELLGLGSTETQTPTGKYTLAVSPGPSADDYADDAGTTGSVAVGGTVQGKIEWEDDQDWIAVALTAGVRYEFELTGTEGSREYPVFGDHIWDGDGNPYARWSGDGDVTERGNTIGHGFFTPEESGTYYVPVEGGSYDDFWDGNRTRNEYWDEALSYTLSVAEAAEPPPEDDYTADTSTTGTVTAGGDAVEGSVERGRDVDWFQVELTADKGYAFVIGGDSDSETPLRWNAILGLYDADGERIANTSSEEQGSAALQSVATWRADETGTYYVAVGAREYSTDTGDYTLEVIDRPDDDMGANSTTTGTLEIDGSSSGVIEVFGDVDWFAVELSADTTYGFDVSSVAGAGIAGSTSFFSLRGLYDEDGGPVFNGGEATKSFTYTASEDGTFFVAVAGGFRQSVRRVPGVCRRGGGRDLRRSGSVPLYEINRFMLPAGTGR